MQILIETLQILVIPISFAPISATGGLAMDGEFYQQWWFLVILALVGLIIIILVTATLCMLGRSRLYVGKYTTIFL